MMVQLAMQQIFLWRLRKRWNPYRIIVSLFEEDHKREHIIEIFRIIPQPKYRDSYDYIYLDNLEGCLSLSCHYKSSTVDLFLLKEYGGKNEHWLRLITLSPSSSFNKIYSPVKPIFYSKSDKQVVISLGCSRLILYNLEEKTVEEVMTHGVLGSGLIDLHICHESLVSVDVPICNHYINVKFDLQIGIWFSLLIFMFFFCRVIIPIKGFMLVLQFLLYKEIGEWLKKGDYKMVYIIFS
ncbi:uncharacterized protein LOC124942768 [Impatiens glandulifera]|uniref:uncharacterized protein LOC124942768 n=1 Tax=Impatiens glandulifera TaxID=253017 RepID=UPI001FB12B86|nr:uncharacterized protein LOC124942768 [Impatiens glandulifera]XP_047339279.1 uncharacterized protein LOC124942768 [Impatiens glandulifera]XP_047339280.1 uncharacterized protein LOC124942768 [Impatiens glandulifera]